MIHFVIITEKVKTRDQQKKMPESESKTFPA